MPDDPPLAALFRTNGLRQSRGGSVCGPYRAGMSAHGARRCRSELGGRQPAARRAPSSEATARSPTTRNPSNQTVPCLSPSGELNHASIDLRSEEHTSELQSLLRNSYAVFSLNKK